MCRYNIYNENIISHSKCGTKYLDELFNVHLEKGRKKNIKSPSELLNVNLNIKETSVHAYIEQAIKNISIQVEQKGGKIEKNLRASNDLVKIDETHFVNVIYNLLDNANKYSIDSAPEILVETYEMGNNFCISLGISPENRAFLAYCVAVGRILKYRLSSCVL